mmetsp:Transcript_50042/g.150569  ORF Transcript_50042/g.150569 Transcript_50042/m.150569 type:complete len:98 (-) Transcript_50042:12-305(-)
MTPCLGHILSPEESKSRLLLVKADTCYDFLWDDIYLLKISFVHVRPPIHLDLCDHENVNIQMCDQNLGAQQHHVISAADRLRTYQFSTWLNQVQHNV